MTSVPEEHRSQAPSVIRCAVITVSDTRTMENDVGGQTIVDMLGSHGHQVVERRIIRDEPGPMRDLLTRLSQRSEIDAILLTGGTGLCLRDQTFETLSQLITKQLPGFGELFRMLSYAEVGAAAMLSRAMGGLLGRTVVLAMPGSPGGVRLAMEKLVLPELGHLVREARR
jgi:molybdenum cofactor biosynthesis protein B